MPLVVKVDDQYWLDYAKVLADSASTSRDQAASRLTAVLGWLWGIYTGAATVGVALHKTEFPLYTAIFIAAPVPLIVVGYWLSIWASSPVLVKIDPQVPADMRAAYVKVIETKDGRLRLALIISLLASITAAASIVLASFATPTSSTILRAKFQQAAGANSALELAGSFSPQKAVTVRVLGFSDSKMSSEVGRYVVTFPLTDDGRLQQSVKPGFAAPFYLVVAEWSGTGETLGISCFVEGESKPAK